MDDAVVQTVRDLFESIGIPPGDFSAAPLAGGRNNRAYRLDTAAGPVLLKHYYRGGDWDRLAAESRFLRFCERSGIGRVPRLLAEDTERGLALHSWVDGDRLSPESLTRRDLDEAAAFLDALSTASRKQDRTAMPPARDACLCLEDFFRSPRERLEDLERALTSAGRNRLAEDALSFFRKDLFPAWENARDTALRELKNEDILRPLPKRSLFASPSDFGFHNALRLRDGSGLAFVDFEYAGIDDPAKAIGDFMCQPTFPPPPDGLAALTAGCGDPDGTLAGRVCTLLPLSRIKFCCIILNEFKQADLVRRNFAISDGTLTLLENQLHKAQCYLKKHTREYR